jgi:putative ABC transport system permease protein
MSSFLAWCAALWRNITRRADVEAQLDQELHSQLQLLADEYVSRGLHPEGAARQARLDFGGVDQLKEAVRSVRAGYSLDELIRDVRYGVRSLRHNPTFTVVSISTIALGVGINTMVFAVLNGAVFRPFVLPGGESIMSVTQRLEGDARRARHTRFETDWVSYPEYQSYRDRNQVLAGLAAYAPFVNATLTDEQTRTLAGALVSCNYFEVLQAPMALGRGMIGADCTTVGPTAVVLSNDTWRTAFASDPRIVGRIVSLNRKPFTVVGIASPRFTPPGLVAAAFWAPLTSQSIFIPKQTLLEDPDASWLALLARPRPAASVQDIRTGLTVIAHQIHQQSSTLHTTLVVEPARMFDMPQLRTAALGVGGMLLGAVVLVLLVACANVASMLLARSGARRREIAVRLALGASRARLVRQMLTESLLLAGAGGTVGLVVAAWSSAALLRFVTGALPPQIPRIAITTELDWRVLAYAGGATVLTAVACGLLPAVRASKADLSGDLKQDCGEPLLQARSLGKWRHLLLSGQMLMSMTLLLPAGLLFRGLYRAETIDPGFQTANIMVLKFDLEAAGYDPAAAATVQAAVLARVSSLPGVSVAQAWASPLSLDGLGGRFSLDNGTAFLGNWNAVSSNYFTVLGTPIVRGREFTAADERVQAGVAIVTESTARRLWPGQDPLGQTLRRRRGPNDIGDLHQVIGVVKDAQVARLGESDSTFVYFPSSPDQSSATLLVRRESAAGSLEAELRGALRDVDPQLVATLSALEDNLGIWRGVSRLAAVSSAVLAFLAVALAAIGVYGVVAYGVSRRTREIGIRMALGASRWNVVSLMLGQTMRPVIGGALLGTICACAIARLLSALLFGLSPYDPVSFTIVPVVSLAIATIASYLPARQATRVNPSIALRYE